MAATVFLVRHAVHDRVGKSLVGRMSGVSLGAPGRAQAERLAERLSREPICLVVTSPLERARETAQPIVARLGCELREAQELNEIDCGEWTGKTIEELRQEPRWQLWNAERASNGVPGGETMRAVQQRVVAYIDRVADECEGSGCVLVSHSDVIKAAVSAYLGLSLDRHDSFDVDPASITTLAVWTGGGKLLRLNEAAA